MNENRKKQRITAYIVGGILLVVLLLTIWIYQMVKINREQAKYDELCAKVEYYRALTDEERATDEGRKTLKWIIDRARELGYTFNEDEEILIKD